MGMTSGAVRGSGYLWRRIASLPVVLAILVPAGCSVVERPASHRLREGIARIRAAGEPLTFEELRAGQSAGEGVDAASDYRAAATLLADLDSGPLFDLVKAYRAGTRTCPPVPPSTEVRERARLMLAQAEPALELIDRAARSEACHYAFNLETDKFPRFAVFHTAGVLLSLRTLEFAFAGAGDRAAASLFSKLRMLRVFETEPVLIAYMVRQAEWTQAGADLRTVLGAGTLSEASVGDLDEALSLAEVPPPSEAGARGRARVRHDLSGRDLGPRLARWRAAVRRYQTSPVLGAPATPWSGERLFRRHRGGDPSGW